MTKPERIDGTKERLRKPGTDAALEEIGEGRQRRMVRRVSADTIDRMIRRNRLTKAQEAASREIERLRYLIGIPLSAANHERSSEGSGDMSQRAAEAFADYKRLMQALRGDNARIITWVFVEGVTLEVVGWRLKPWLTAQSKKIAEGDKRVLEALDAAASYFGY